MSDETAPWILLLTAEAFEQAIQYIAREHKYRQGLARVRAKATDTEAR